MYYIYLASEMFVSRRRTTQHEDAQQLFLSEVINWTAR